MRINETAKNSYLKIKPVLQMNLLMIVVHETMIVVTSVRNPTCVRFVVNLENLMNCRTSSNWAHIQCTGSDSTKDYICNFSVQQLFF